jgi:3-oxoadipate enol-lactonase
VDRQRELAPSHDGSSAGRPWTVKSRLLRQPLLPLSGSGTLSGALRTSDSRLQVATPVVAQRDETGVLTTCGRRASVPPARRPWARSVDAAKFLPGLTVITSVNLRPTRRHQVIAEQDRSARASRLHYRLDGPAGAPVVVLGPSLGTSLEMWDAQIPALTERWQVLRYDLRGHGNSPAPDGPYTIADLAQDVLALLDQLRISRVAFCGVSLGGAIGTWLAVHHPDRLSALVLCCTAARFGEPEAWHDRAYRVRTEGSDWLAEPTTQRWFTGGFPTSSPTEVHRLLMMLRGVQTEGYAGCCDALAGFDLRSRLREIRIPTLVIAGADDPATPVTMSRELAHGIPDADLVVVPDAAHLANVEQPSAVTAAIVDHLNRVYKEPAPRS